MVEKEMKLIEIISFNEICDLIFKAENQLYISLPSIDEEIADALIDLRKSGITQIVVDNSEDAIRNGFGDEKGIDKLLVNKFHIRQSDGNMISFIISDNTGYFLFPQSKIFLERPKGANAFKIDPVTIQLLIQHYFPVVQETNEVLMSQTVAIEDTIKHFEAALQDVKKQGSDVSISQFDDEKYIVIKTNLNINPPLSPNLQRQINTYTAKIQFVELKFIGGDLKNRIAQLPKNAIPINSDELKSLLMTRIKMFQDISNNPEYENFQKFKDKIEQLRKDYLTPVTCRPNKSILKIENKEKFIGALDKLKKESASLNEILTTVLTEEKLNTMELLRKELVSFFNKNEPDEVKRINNANVKVREIDRIINGIIALIKFPSVHKMIEKISINELYYDLTWNDFKDEKLQQEFLKKGIMKKDEIDSIVDLKKAFDVKK